MANEHNLIKPSDLTPSERRESASRAGKASGEARRRKKTLKQTMKLLLEQQITDVDIYNQTAAMGVDANDLTHQSAIVAAMVKRVEETGDPKAFALILELMGEDTNSQRLKLQKQELAQKKKASEGSDGKLTELIEGLKDDLHE